MSSRWISIELQRRRAWRRGRVDLGVDRLDQRGLAHAARAPEERVVGRQAAREAFGVVRQRVAHAVDAAQKRHLDPVDLGDGRQPPAGGCQTKASAAAKSGAGGAGGRDAVEGRGDLRSRV